MENCIFCKIINKEFKSNIIYEDNIFVIFADINPKAKYHWLAVPKQHYALISEGEPQDIANLSHMLQKIPELSEILHLDNGYRLQINQGKGAGQEVPHLHIHILAGFEN